jgi:Family of unknown function (DUF5678)
MSQMNTAQPYSEPMSTQPRASFPGEIEAQWMASDPAELIPYQGRWVGILGEAVVASGDNFAAVYEQLEQPDVLIVRIPTDEDRKRVNIFGVN